MPARIVSGACAQLMRRHSSRCGHGSSRPGKKWWPDSTSTPRALSRRYSSCAGDGQAREPQPQEERALRPVDAQRQVACRPPAATRRPGASAPRSTGRITSRQSASSSPLASSGSTITAPVEPGASAAVALNAVIASIDRLGGHHDARARGGQAELREAQAEDDVLVPEQPAVGELDARERQAVGRIDDQRHAAPRARGRRDATSSSSVSTLPGRVGRPRHADRRRRRARPRGPRSRSAVLEEAAGQFLDVRASRAPACRPPDRRRRSRCTRARAAAGCAAGRRRPPRRRAG